eukprot:TRINITY_DN2781_c0_g4_i1.p1 TRINITY_DN2781_c0_g4~~TRINITY_DN2781_c0_g4_i1.p1  ORF type:complete len:340 (-),score=119.40 TRINITY_DN2781_c0_g4_i1:280-1272(-)
MLSRLIVQNTYKNFVPIVNTSLALKSPSNYNNLLINNSINLQKDVLQKQEMASLKDLKIRIESVKSIKKITASMKLVAASKLKGAQLNMEKSRPFWDSTKSLFQGRGMTEYGIGEDPFEEEPKKPLFVILTSDRGLCGSINSSLVKLTKRHLARYPNAKLIIIGEKGKGSLIRQHSKNFICSATDIGKKSIAFADVEDVASSVCKVDYDQAYFISNKFVSVIAYETLQRKLANAQTIFNEADFVEYEMEENKTELLDYAYQYYVSSLLFSSLTENVAAELSARMTSMENASKNAGEMLLKLERTYNRQRQAGITTELSEIISGAESIKEE